MSLEFRCEKVGVECGAKLTADTEEELIAKIADHADKTHGVPKLTQTLVNYARSTVTTTGSASSPED